MIFGWRNNLLFLYSTRGKFNLEFLAVFSSLFVASLVVEILSTCL